MSIATGTLTVNPAFLREIKDDHLQLKEVLAALRELAENPTLLSAQRSRAVVLIVELREQLALHFSLEEAFGYFDDAVDVAPHLAPQAEELKVAHIALYETACALADDADNCQRRREPIRRLLLLMDVFLEFDAELLEHEERENALILAALQDDIGVGD